MGAEFRDRKKTAHHAVKPGEVLAEIERKPQSWRQPIVVNRKDLITPPRPSRLVNGYGWRRSRQGRKSTRHSDRPPPTAGFEAEGITARLDPVQGPGGG